MLFDLRGKRRRTVQVVYASLAILMGGGLVLFGIGGDVQGGIVDAFRGEETSTEDLFGDRIDALEQRVAANPQSPEAWAQLAKLHYQVAGTGENFDQSTGTFTESGVQELAQAERAWERYLALDPEEPDDQVASLMVQAFGPAGLQKPDQAVRAMEIVVDQREESAGLYTQLAVYAYQAGQTRKAELAADKAVELADPEDRELIRAQLQAAEQQAALGANGGADPGATGGG